jgi:hypothetical protein
MNKLKIKQKQAIRIVCNANVGAQDLYEGSGFIRNITI